MHETMWNAALTMPGSSAEPEAGISSPVKLSGRGETAVSEFALARLLRESELSSRPEIAISRSIVLLLALRPEVVQVSVLIAICASAANVLTHRADPRAVRALTQFYPVGSSRLILASSRYTRLAGENDVSHALQAFHAAVPAAMNATMAYKLTAPGERSRQAVPGASLSLAWQAACSAAHNLLAAIDDAICALHPQACANESDILMSELRRAQHGGTPMRTAAGDFEVPAWLERRSGQRLKVSCEATLSWSRTAVTVQVTDMSTGGIGIETVLPVREGDNVIIKIGEVVLPGTIIWRHASRAGIAFDQALVIDSPTYRFLSTHAQAEPDGI